MRHVHVACDGPEVEAEHLAAVLKLPVGTLTVDLTRELRRQHVRAWDKDIFSLFMSWYIPVQETEFAATRLEDELFPWSADILKQLDFIYFLN